MSDTEIIIYQAVCIKGYKVHNKSWETAVMFSILLTYWKHVLGPPLVCPCPEMEEKTITNSQVLKKNVKQVFTQRFLRKVNWSLKRKK